MGTARGEVVAAWLSGGGFVAGVGWLVDYSTGEMTQIRDCQLNLVYD